MRHEKDGKQNELAIQVDESEDFGDFEVFRRDGIPGHNRSIGWVNDAVADCECTVRQVMPEWREGGGVEIRVDGMSGTNYLVKATSDVVLLDAYEGRIITMVENEEDTTAAIEAFGPKVIKFEVSAYDPVSRSWDRVCIELPAIETDSSDEEQDDDDRSYRVSGAHPLDVVAGLIRALRQDLTAAKKPKMNTLRMSLLRNWADVWLMDKEPYPENFVEYRKLRKELHQIYLDNK